MTTLRLFPLFTAALIFGSGLSAQSGTGGSNDNAPVSPDTSPVRTPTTPAPAPDTPPPSAPNPSTPAIPADTNPTATIPVRTAGDQTWGQIRDHPFAQRGEFMAGLSRFDAQMEKSITQLKARRTAFTGDPNAWDSEMKRLDDAHAHLKFTSSELAKATAANWDERKERVSTAWERLQSAYERASGMATP
jgi:hypothetical protein